MSRVVTLTLGPTKGTTTTTLYRILPNPNRYTHVRLHVLLRMIRRIIRPILSLTLKLLQRRRVTVKVSSMTITLTTMDATTSRFLCNLVPVTRNGTNMNNTISLRQHGKHEMCRPTLPTPRSMTKRHELTNTMRLLGNHPRIVRFFVLTPSTPVFTIFVRRVRTTMPPSLPLNLVTTRTFLHRTLLVNDLRTLTPLIRRIPITPTRSNGHLVRLLVNLRRITNTFIVRLLPSMRSMPTRAYRRSRYRRRHDYHPSFFFLPRVRLLLDEIPALYPFPTTFPRPTGPHGSIRSALPGSTFSIGTFIGSCSLRV